jgi:hypothetical protein
MLRGIFSLVSCVLKVKYLIQFSLQPYRNTHAYVKNSVSHHSAMNQQPDKQPVWLSEGVILRKNPTTLPSSRADP